MAARCCCPPESSEDAYRHVRQGRNAPEAQKPELQPPPLSIRAPPAAPRQYFPEPTSAEKIAPAENVAERPSEGNAFALRLRHEAAVHSDGSGRCRQQSAQHAQKS